MGETSIQELMDMIPQAFVPEKAAGIDGTVQFHLLGDKGGDWLVRIKDQVCTVERASVADAKLTLTAEAQDMLDIFAGKLDGMKAFMTGKLKMQGDMSLAMKFIGLFKMDPEQLKKMGI
jgi:putative sterol carrier protein